MDRSSLEKELAALAAELEASFAAITDPLELKKAYKHFFGKQSAFQQYLKSLKQLPPEAQREIGPLLQTFKQTWHKQYLARESALLKAQQDEKLSQEYIDVTKPVAIKKGGIHPLSQIQREVEEIFASMGFEIADGPEVESEWYNFDALNIPATHPARDMQDTFFVKGNHKDPRKSYVLRTHTSPVQIRKMQERGAPLRIIAPGRVYRNEEVDATHDATFHQVEGMVIDTAISLAHLKYIILKMLERLLKKKPRIRIRPGYFPFVEPGLEIDIWWEYEKDGEKKGKWLEFMGAGMMHPKVLLAGGIDPQKYRGFAFGFGLTRLVMLKYGIEDIRHLHTKSKAFLQQF